MKRVTRCNLCGGKSFHTVFKNLPDRMIGARGRFSIRCCASCSLMVTDPVLSTIADFKKYYPDSYYSYNPPGSKSFKDRLALYLYNLFYNPRQRYNPLRYALFPVSYFVRGTHIVPGARILDIGCGGGYFLQRMKDLGMRPYGIELGDRGVQECRRRRILVWDVPVEKAPIKNNFFDVITISAVLEHVADVKATLKASYKVLKPGGRIVIMVPNARGFSARIYGEYWSEWDIPRHITHFTKNDLRRYLEETGFTDIHFKNVGSSFQFTQSLSYWYPRLSGLFQTRVIAMLFNVLVFTTNILGVPGRIEAYATKR